VPFFDDVSRPSRRSSPVYTRLAAPLPAEDAVELPAEVWLPELDAVLASPVDAAFVSLEALPPLVEAAAELPEDCCPPAPTEAGAAVRVSRRWSSVKTWGFVGFFVC